MSDASLSPFNSSISSCSSPSEAASPRTTILPEDLPLPTAPRPFPTKKSHARKQPLGHIPRPRNAFILFRCDYGRQNERTTRERDQNDVSRMVGHLWRNMTDDQRAPWVVMAEAEKKKHAALYPGYKYTPRLRKSKPTEKAVKKQIEKEAEKVVEAETIARVNQKISQDMVTVYYPPWATRRTLTYFARRATSCPPPGSVGIEPYSETLDRSMVTTSALPKAEPKEAEKEEQLLRSPKDDVFVPSTYGIHDADYACPSEATASWAIRADHSLSQSSYAIGPPGGTSSWGEGPPSPSEYPRNPSMQYAYRPNQDAPPFIYTQQGEFAMHDFSSYANSTNQPRYDKWSQEIPALQPPSPNDDTPASLSPITPPEYCASPRSPVTATIQTSAEPASHAPSGDVAFPPSFSEKQTDDFLSEFGTILQSPSKGYEASDEAYAGVNIVPRESSVRTTYTP